MPVWGRPEAARRAICDFGDRSRRRAPVHLRRCTAPQPPAATMRGIPKDAWMLIAWALLLLVDDRIVQKHGEADAATLRIQNEGRILQVHSCGGEDAHEARIGKR